MSLMDRFKQVSRTLVDTGAKTMLKVRKTIIYFEVDKGICPKLSISIEWAHLENALVYVW